MVATYTSDQELISAVRGGDEKALKLIYSRHWPMVLRFVKLNNGDDDEAEEVFQEGMITFYEKIREKDFMLSCSLKTYLYSVCRFKWMNQLRKRKDIVDIESYSGDFPDHEEDQEEPASPEAIKQKVLTLGEPCLSLLIGFYYDELSLEQLASSMSYANANVAKQQKFRCLERLKKMFSGRSH